MIGSRIFVSSTVLAMVLITVGCASKPVVQQNRKMVVVPEFYTVQAGESLSSIAAKFGLNYMHIAQLNQIQAVDKIYVNQSLRLQPGKQNLTTSVQTRPIESAAEIKRESVSVSTVGLGAQVTPTPVTPIIPVKPTLPTVSTPTTAPVIAVTKQITQGWALPSKGKVIDRFDVAKDKKGLYFGGNVGDPVYAAKDGEVVYSDNGLKEYGQLVLIRHTEGYITAYAHNSQLIAKVGDRVQAGQKIAEMGNSGATQVMLQFQIRLDGKPIDPATILAIN